ncbi:MAG: SRPBCC family protein [Thaumarchaeota archaeon]|nr:SRPBCC family protein [Nitrososphaerota archaeon]
MKEKRTMETINASREIRASTDRVWEIVSDVDNDPEYWKGVTSLHNLRKEGNVVERSVVVGFMGHKGLQRIELKPRESIELTMTKGPMKGSREIKLVPLDGGERTRIEISWNFQFSGVPIFARPFVTSQIVGTTKEALERIAEAAVKPSSPLVRTRKETSGPGTQPRTSATARS